MDHDADDTARLTLDLLEARLRQAEYTIYGHLDGNANSRKRKSVAERLHELEKGLDVITAKSKVAQDLLKLRARHPDLFYSPDSEVPPSLLDLPSKSAIVLSSAASFPLTASSLTSIRDTPIPEAERSAKIIATRPQVSELEALQAAQTKTIASLKERTAAVLQRWYSVDILQSGEHWAEIEGRIDTMEQGVRRAEIARQEEEATG
ncbi:hypothetical protein V499_00126 [Pseudogymnoascus sp. VKM F-103]|uniref:Uncharacterized protein n=1 Tax=Pseudogymnoascus verrucosus TaxID=342668 RepID=A0A2P2SXP2_9PEZI|nr:uncharacterized protein VE01_00513 [Pseudogymnoascus verrucosus]KFY81088.1 hypothetical protein V499_00126 [Pseudogymnoascus sp. VKM F-103]OBU01600.1 hypothetical protein VE01_00513 [Pseudogymnoascus verrucosus]